MNESQNDEFAEGELKEATELQKKVSEEERDCQKKSQVEKFDKDSKMKIR